jgi:hypothetical protein
MIPIEQILTLGNLLQRWAQVQGIYPIKPPDRLVEETRTRRFPVVDGKNEANGSSC